MPQGSSGFSYRALCAAMRSRGVMAGVAAGVLLAGCGDNGSARFVDAESSVLGESIQGELTSKSDVNLNDGSRHDRRWVCPSDGDETTLYELDAPFAASLTVFDESGRRLGGATSDEDDAARLMMTPGESCTLVVISGDGASAFGPFSLAPTSLPDGDALVDGESVSGELGTDAETYRLSLDEARRVNLTLNGGQQGTLSLSGGNDTAVQAARCYSGQQSLSVFLDAGDYEVALTPGGTGTQANASQCQSRTLSVGSGYLLSMQVDDLSRGERNQGPLRDGDSITGTLAANGASNDYSLSVVEPVRVNIALSASGFDTVLEVSGGEVNLRNDDADGQTNSRIESVLMPGEYSVSALGYGNEGGDYALEVSTQPFDGELRNSGELVAGETLQGMASSGGATYSLNVDTTSEVDLRVSATDFDTVLAVRGEGVQLGNDDFEGSTDSRIQSVLEPGEYQVEVSSYGGSASGTFELATTVTSFEGELRNSGVIEPGAPVMGMLSSGTDNQYEFTLEETAQVSLSVSSQAFDTVLEVSGPNTELRDDDGATDGTTNSRMRSVLEPGTYTARVLSYQGEGTFTLQLEATAFDGELRSSGEIRSGETVQGQLDAGGSLEYELVVEQASRLSLESGGQGIDTVMELSGQGVKLVDDDGGSNYGSRIETELEPGTYQLRVTGYQADAGLVQVEVKTSS